MGRTLNTSHSEIFDYWKDKAITKDGDVVLDADKDEEKISVVRDWTNSTLLCLLRLYVC